MPASRRGKRGDRQPRRPAASPKRRSTATRCGSVSSYQINVFHVHVSVSSRSQKRGHVVGLLARRCRGEMIMKAILLAALVALSVLGGASVSASAEEYDY